MDLLLLNEGDNRNTNLEILRQLIVYVQDFWSDGWNLEALMTKKIDGRSQLYIALFAKWIAVRLSIFFKGKI
jgi:hypothetical protein